MRLVNAIGALVMLVAAGCAQRVPAPATVTPTGALAALEARQARHPRDPDVLTDVGVGFYQAGEYARARDVFAAVLVLQPNAFLAAVHLGLANEGLGDYDAALAAYHRAEGMKVSKQQRRQVEERLIALTRARLAALARRAVAEERAIAATPAVPNTIAVLPWSYLGTDPDLKPLETGLAHLVVSDLSKVGRYTLLERERVRALVEELALGTEGRTQLETAARSGRLLRAAQVVQGTIRETGPRDIRLDANVVSASTAKIDATGSASNRLSELFAMEKSLVFDLLGRLGVTLSPAEQRAIGERPTADLQAFLAFSRGLEAEDRGDFSAATRFFQQAATRDPSFRAARERAASSARIAAASRMTAARLAALIERFATGPGADRGNGGTRAAQLRAGVQGVAPSLAGRLARAQSRQPGSIRSRLAEALRQDDPGKLNGIGQILITIPRP
jgi:tetratricopeptide (TPR) repeat protein